MLEKLQQQLSLRDQGMLALLAGALVLYVLYQVLLHPLAVANQRLENQNDAARKSLATVTQMAAEINALRQSGTHNSNAQNENLTQLIDRTVAENNLRMSRFQPGSSGDVQVRLDNMPFDQVLRWLNELESSHGVVVRELVVAPGSASGLVNVSARLFRA
ncbi:MAG TPA: type II secretion system protein M [Spongiibacteraceae bacterium]|nr:type II secretion system protein M [Spongiibacteraceae bacterium]